MYMYVVTSCDKGVFVFVVSSLENDLRQVQQLHGYKHIELQLVSDSARLLVLPASLAVFRLVLLSFRVVLLSFRLVLLSFRLVLLSCRLVPLSAQLL